MYHQQWCEFRLRFGTRQSVFNAGLDDCIIEENEYRSSYSQIGDQEIWHKYTIDECILWWKTRAWKEGKKEIEDIKINIFRMLDKSEADSVSRADIINLCYGANSKI